MRRDVGEMEGADLRESGETLLAVAQFAPSEDRAANLAGIERLVSDATGEGARLVVLPEYASYFARRLGPTYARNAETLDGPFVTALAALAARTGAVLVAGLVERTAHADRVANTVVAVTPGDGLAAVYRKQHLYDAFGGEESAWIVPGALTPPQTVDVDGLVVGLQTCYDLRFPEATRRLVDAGADVVAVPSEWVAGPEKEFHWRALLAARAIENTVFVLGADHPPPVGVGASAIVDPAGTTLASLDAGEGVAIAAASGARLARVRAANPSLAARRYRVVPVDGEREVEREREAEGASGSVHRVDGPRTDRA